jgi:hypothetical protein
MFELSGLHICAWRSQGEGLNNVVIPTYNPRLNDIHRYFESYVERGEFKPIVGNDRSRMTIALAFPLMKIPIMIRGPAGSGKTTIIKAAVSMTWGKDVIDDKVREVLYVAGASECGLLTDTMVHRIRDTCTHCVVPELQNALKDERTEAIIKLWAEGESYSYKRAANGGRVTQDITLPPLPIITSIANENKYSMKLGEEIERRFFPFYTVSNTKLNKQIHKTKADAWILPQEDLVKMSDEEKTRLRVHMLKASKLPHRIRNPCAMFMTRYMPSNYVVSNSMIGYWLGLVGAVTKFNFTQRMTFKRGEIDYMLATPEDNWVAWIIGGESLIMGCNNIPDMGTEILEILPIRDEFSRESGLTLSGLMDTLHTRGIERNRNQIKTTLLLLELSNYVKKEEYGKDPVYYRTDDYSFETAVDWKSCVKETIETVTKHFPDLAEEYVDRFCTEPAVVEPFTNEMLSLLEIPFEPMPLSTKTLGGDVKTPGKAMLKLEEYM